jgi:carbonic anhydrase/acetyltransferase-like protein (isoleucine patch superfamily)
VPLSDGEGSDRSAIPLRPFGAEWPAIGARVYVDRTAVVIGRVALGDDASVWPMCVLRGDVNAIRIGARTNVQDATIVHVTHEREGPGSGLACIVGEDVTVGHRVTLHGCTVGNRCLIGMGAIVMDGVVIEDEVLLAAGSVVPPGKQLRSRSLYLGNPARRVRAVTAAEIEDFAYSAAHYVKLKDRYLPARA